jgi:hypothetical protein
MRGGFRIRKKHLKQAGWICVEERKEPDGKYQLILQKSDDEKVTVEGSTKTRAYMRAAQELLAKGEA